MPNIPHYASKVSNKFCIDIVLKFGYNLATVTYTVKEITMQIIPMRDLKNTVEIEKRCAETCEPIFVTKNGYGKLVVMDIETYDRTLRQAFEAKLVNESLEDIKNGAKLVAGEEVRKRIMSSYGKAII